jgi:hypothetical protein
MSLVLQEESEVVTISGYHDVPQNSEESLLKALANQPLSVAIEASGRDFQFYSGVGQHLLHTHTHTNTGFVSFILNGRLTPVIYVAGCF